MRENLKTSRILRMKYLLRMDIKIDKKKIAYFEVYSRLGKF